jgi:hypothetical protein
MSMKKSAAIMQYGVVPNLSPCDEGGVRDVNLES